MRILRFENSAGKGVYRVCCAEELGYMGGSTLRHPTPCADPMLRSKWYALMDAGEDPYYLFGFSCVEHARAWFDCNALEYMGTRGVGLSVYEAPDEYAYSSEHQAIFHMQHGKLVRHYHDPVEGIEIEGELECRATTGQQATPPEHVQRGIPHPASLMSAAHPAQVLAA